MKMKYEVVEVAARQIVGCSVRSANNAPDCQQKIGALWEKMLHEERKEGICYGLYTEYQWEDMSYLAVVGTEGSTCPADGVCIQIPAGTYARFHFQGNVRTGIHALWQEIWKMELPRAYTVDFEEYVKCNADGQGEVYVYVALANYCQSCAMPMTTPEQYGTEADGTPSKEYCCYCRKNGAFVQDCTMEEMVEFCLQYGPAASMDKEQARKQMSEYFSTLKRWQKK